MIEFKLDPKSGVPFYRQIIDQIRYGISAGHLKVGEQLPTVRALAVELKVNLNTVNKAYKELEIQNILETQQGTGTFIGAVGVKIASRERQDKLKAICREFLSIAFSYGFGAEEIVCEIRELEGGRK
jgi:GntR family transcriptional regulator